MPEIVLARRLLVEDDIRCCYQLLADTMKQQVSGKSLGRMFNEGTVSKDDLVFFALR